LVNEEPDVKRYVRVVLFISSRNLTFYIYVCIPIDAGLRR
jgi:hypothetical protein